MKGTNDLVSLKVSVGKCGAAMATSIFSRVDLIAHEIDGDIAPIRCLDPQRIFGLQG